MNTEWALEPTGNQLVGPTGTLAPLGRSTAGTICPRSADRPSHWDAATTPFVYTPVEVQRHPTELPNHGSPRGLIYVGGVLSPMGPPPTTDDH